MNPAMKLVCVLVIASRALCVSSDETIDISTFKKNPGGGIICDENFNSGPGAWKLGKGFELKSKAGVIGSNALFADCPAPAVKGKYLGSASLPIKVIPGSVCQVSIQYRASDIKPRGRRRPHFILGYIQAYDKNGKKLKGQNFWVNSKFTKGWQSFCSSVTIPGNAVADARLNLVFDWWHTGKIWFDNITLKNNGTANVILPVVPSNLALDSDGDVALKVFSGDGKKDNNLAMLVSLNNKKRLLRPENGVYRGKFGRFKGTVKVKAKLLDLKNKTILAEHDYQLFGPQTTAPDGATGIDKYGRTLCNGNPILPIGTFTYQRMREEDLKRVRDAGFDFISFGCRALNLQGKNSNSTREMAKMLDGLKKFNLKAMLQLTLMIPAKEHLRKKYEPDFDGFKSRDELVTALVKAVRNNPAFLAYYLSDENQRSELQQVQQLRELVSKTDPWHFTVTLTDRPDNFPFFVPTGDVLCHDNYPLPRVNEVAGTDSNLQALAGLRTPIWFCAQGCLWRILNKKKAVKPDPGEGAVRAVPLLAAIHGAKGFLFYSYHEVFAKGSKFEPEHPAEFWPKVVSAVKMLRELEPFILSITEAPALKLENRQGKIRCRIMKTAAGNLAIPIVAFSPGKSSVRIKLPSGKKFYSRYGLSRRQTDGTWLFTANGIDCDIIYSK